MTHNQLTYWELKERERANRAQEAETHRANVEREAHNVRTLQHDKDLLKWDRQKFNRSNWHVAVKNVGSGIGGAVKGISPILALFGL